MSKIIIDCTSVSSESLDSFKAKKPMAKAIG